MSVPDEGLPTFRLGGQGTSTADAYDRFCGPSDFLTNLPHDATKLVPTGTAKGL